MAGRGARAGGGAGGGGRVRPAREDAAARGALHKQGRRGALGAASAPRSSANFAHADRTRARTAAGRPLRASRAPDSRGGQSPRSADSARWS